MDYKLHSKIYRIVNYTIQEYIIESIDKNGRFTLLNTSTHKRTYANKQVIENYKEDFTSYSISKIYLLNSLKERLEYMLQEVTTNILQYKDDYFERTKKYDNLKYVIEEDERASRKLANKAKN